MWSTGHWAGIARVGLPSGSHPRTSPVRGLRADFIDKCNPFATMLFEPTLEIDSTNMAPTFTLIDLDQQAAPIELVVGEVEQMECLADAPVLTQRPRQG
jgi:hypothetical protein